MRRPARRVSSYNFTASVMMAIYAMMELASSAGFRAKLKGADDFTNLPKPVWHNFYFFRRILAKPIRMKERVEAHRDRDDRWVMGHWVVEREVRFYREDQLVAIVYLEGMKPDKAKGNEDNKSVWAISRIAYRSDPHYYQEILYPGEWKEFDFEVGLYFEPCLS